MLLPALPAAPTAPAPTPDRCGPFSSPDHVVESWDGTPLAASVHVPDGDGPFPAILRAHGYAGSRAPASHPFVSDLTDAGFLVLTWDARGFGQSGGEVRFDDPAYEGRDALQLLRWLNTTSPHADDLARDAGGDPIVGMSGGSYGGGVQWSALVADQIIGPAPGEPPTDSLDALAPEITWHNLSQAAIPGGVPKTFIDALLTGAGAGSARVGGAPPPADGFCPNADGQNEDQHRAVASGFAENGRTDRTDRWTGLRSIETYLDHPDLDVPPTFLAQGLRDTTLPPNEALDTFTAIRGETDAKVMLHSTGHGWSGAPPAKDADLLAWFEHTLQDRPLPARLDGNDLVYAADGRLGATMGDDLVYTDYDDVVATPPTTLDLPGPDRPLLTLPAPTSYADVTFFQGDVDGQENPGRARTFDAPGTAVAWDLPVDGELALVGTPHLTLTVETTTDELFLFAKLYEVDEDGRAEVLYHQAMAKALRGHGAAGPTTVAWDLAALSAEIPADHTLRAAVSTSDAMHASSREPGATLVLGGQVEMPVEGGELGPASAARPGATAR